MSKALQNQQRRHEAYREKIAKTKEEHSRYLACLLTIENFPGPMTVQEIRRIVHAALYPDDSPGLRYAVSPVVTLPEVSRPPFFMLEDLKLTFGPHTWGDDEVASPGEPPQ